MTFLYWELFPSCNVNVAQSSVPFVSLKVFDMQLADAIKRGVFP